MNQHNAARVNGLVNEIAGTRQVDQEIRVVYVRDRYAKLSDT